ncbi:hypothetical protein NKR19_g3540 [Coniochaeta hoffmannii]|uniref:Carbohydrate-binding module family 18 protein n=1 Tax=Coniochaeta hoffmannii TaxID=91930 RepID=A0AA38SGN9_9PEZI|nr:hypothetical protein NKR19_g3540 [Coniochaeta hoffmannii]
MLQSRVPGLLLAASLYLTPVLAATCTRTVTAKAGDTCASLSTSNSLTVAQFIQLNPTIATCSLLPGATYCVSDDPAAITIPAPTSSSSTRPAAAPTGSLVPSPDGSEGVCGGSTGYTCLGSVYGDCCSENGYCGNTTEYCDAATGCNAVFGRCGGGTSPVDEPSGTGGGTTTVTVTVITGGAAPTCPAAPTRTVTATMTVNQTVTKLQTVTQTHTVTATTSAAAARPSPILEGTTSRCKTYYQWKNTDTCTRLARTLGVTEDQLYTWNPALDCDDPPRGYYICVGL